MGKRRFGHIGTKVKDVTQSSTENSGIFDINEVAILVAEDKWRKFNTVNCDYIVVAGGGGGGGGCSVSTDTSSDNTLIMMLLAAAFLLIRRRYYHNQ